MTITQKINTSYATSFFHSDGKKTTRLGLCGSSDHKTKVIAKNYLVNTTLFFDKVAAKFFGSERKWVKINLHADSRTNLEKIKDLCKKIITFIKTRKWANISSPSECLININSLCKRTSLSRKEILSKSTKELSAILANPKDIIWDYSNLNNDLFPHVLLINLDSRNDRLESLNKHLEKIGATLNYERVSAVSGSDLKAEEVEKMSRSDAAIRRGDDDRKGRLGCFKSHLNALKHAQKNKWPEVLITEDDVRFIPNYFATNYARQAKKELPEDWGMLFLGYYEGDKAAVKPYSDHLIQPGHPLDLHGYMVNSCMYDKLIRALEKELEKGANQMRAIDVVIAEEMPKTGKVFCCKDNIAIQDEGFSSITQRKIRGNYSKELRKFREELSLAPLSRKTSDNLPVMDPLLAGTLYQMMHHISTIFDKHGVQHFIECGTLLGAERHKGLIPWDDDIDIDLLPGEENKLQNEDLKKDLAAVGLEIVDHWLGAKICALREHPLGFQIEKDGYKFKTPNIDLFFTKKETREGEEIYAYGTEKARDIWPDYFIKESELFREKEGKKQMNKVPFGPLQVNGLWDQKSFCLRFYGSGCLGEGYLQYDHIREKALERRPVLMTDFRPPLFKQWNGISPLP